MSERAATSYFFASRSRVSGVGGPADRVGALDGQRAALLGVPVVEDLAHDHRLRARLGDVGELEGRRPAAMSSSRSSKAISEVAAESAV